MKRLKYLFLIIIIATQACKRPPVDQLHKLTLDLKGRADFTLVYTSDNSPVNPGAVKNNEEIKISFTEVPAYTFSQWIGADYTIGDDAYITLTDDETITAEFTPNVNNVVAAYGDLSIEGNQMVDQYGEPIQLRGMSLFWSIWSNYYTSEIVDWLADDWECTIVRAAMGQTNGSWSSQNTKMIEVIDAAIAKGMYVLIDWHSHDAENYTQESKEFFGYMASTYGSYDNVLFEVYNEPKSSDWSLNIKPYAEAVIDTIREHSDNIIIVGTRNWSQEVGEAADDPIDGDNIAYTLHFYSRTHGSSLRSKAKDALNKGIALFVTEWGTTTADGGQSSPYSASATEPWLDFMDDNNLSSCNWSIIDKNESSAALESGATTTPTAPTGWDVDNDLTSSGQYVRSYILEKQGFSNPL